MQNVVGETYLITDLTLVRAASVWGADGGEGCAGGVGAPDLAGCLRRGRLVHGFGQRHVACSLADELVLGQAESPAAPAQSQAPARSSSVLVSGVFIGVARPIRGCGWSAASSGRRRCRMMSSTSLTRGSSRGALPETARPDPREVICTLKRAPPESFDLLSQMELLGEPSTRVNLPSLRMRAAASASTSSIFLALRSAARTDSASSLFLVEKPRPTRAMTHCG